MAESRFQSHLIDRLRDEFPSAIIIKTDANYLQGIPDLLILYLDKWALLECKDRKNAKIGPNQEYYVDLLREMSYASFIYPENEEEVLDELREAFRSRGPARVSFAK